MFYYVALLGRHIRKAVTPCSGTRGCIYIYTREILLERSSTEDQELSPVFRQGMKYIVIDLGGVSIFIFRSYVMLMFL